MRGHMEATARGGEGGAETWRPFGHVSPLITNRAIELYRLQEPIVIVTLYLCLRVSPYILYIIASQPHLYKALVGEACFL